MTVVNNKYRGSKEYLLVYAELISAARYKGTVSYQEIAALMGLPLQGNYMSSETGHILGEISEDEVTNGRPMLSAIAVTSKGQPGSGFFGLAKMLGKLEDESEERKLQFWKAEKANVYAKWQKELKSDR